MNNQLLMASKLLIPWLQTNLGVSSAVKHRSKFEGAFKIALLEKLHLIGIDAAPEVNRVDISWQIEKQPLYVELKTINTNFNYKNCIKTTRPITKNIDDIITDINKLKGLGSRESYICFISFPCSNNDKNWAFHFAKIEKHLSNYHEIEFLFANQTPGILYVGKIKEENGEGNLKENVTKENYNTNSTDMKNNIEIGKYESGKRGRVLLKTGTYAKVLRNLSDYLKSENKTITISELEMLFENEIIQELRNQNPKLTEQEFDESLISFRNGAKKLQIILHTINNKLRINFRNNLKVDSKYNNFIIVNPDNSCYYSEKLITSFDKNVSKFLDYSFYFSEGNQLKELSIRQAYPIQTIIH